MEQMAVVVSTEQQLLIKNDIHSKTAKKFMNHKEAIAFPPVPC